jgi:hypothetical protein
MTQDNLPPEEKGQTPLETVKEQQAERQENREVTEKRVDTSAEVPGQSVPSDRKHHPQRQLN